MRSVSAPNKSPEEYVTLLLKFLPWPKYRRADHTAPIKEQAMLKNIQQRKKLN